MEKITQILSYLVAIGILMSVVLISTVAANQDELGVWIDNAAIVDMSKLVDMDTKLVFISGGDINYNGSLSNTDKIDSSFINECYLNNIHVHLWLGYWKYKDWDDDRDGQIDEDQIDGIDNDGDAQIDEDPAGLSEINWLEQNIEGTLVRERLKNEIIAKIVDVYSDKIAGIHFNIEGFNEPSQDIKENVANSYNTFLSELKTESGKTISITPEPFIKWNVQNNPIDEADFFVAMLYWAAAYGSNNYSDICNDFSHDKYSWLKCEVEEEYASKAETFNKDFYVFVGTFGVWVDELNDDKNIIDMDHGPREELKSKYYGIGEVFNSASESEVANSEFVKGHSPGLTDIVYDYLDTAGVLLYRFGDKKTLVWKTPQGIVRGLKIIEDNGGNKYRGSFVFLYDSTQEPEWNAIKGYVTYPIPKVSREEISNDGVTKTIRISLTNQQKIEDTQWDEWANGVHIHLENAEFISVDKGDFDEDYAFNAEAEEIDIGGSNIIELAKSYMQAEGTVSSGEIKIQVTGGNPVICYRGWMRDKDDMVGSHHPDHTGEQVNYVARDPFDYTDDRFDGTSNFMEYMCYSCLESIGRNPWLEDPWFMDLENIDPIDKECDKEGCLLAQGGKDWWGLHGYTWDSNGDIFKIDECKFKSELEGDNDYNVYLYGKDDTNAKKDGEYYAYSAITLIQGNVWDGSVDWSCPEPISISDNDMYIDIWLEKGESGKLHEDCTPENCRVMYAINIWLKDGLIPTTDERPYNNLMVLDLIFYLGEGDEPYTFLDEDGLFHYQKIVNEKRMLKSEEEEKWMHHYTFNLNNFIAEAIEKADSEYGKKYHPDFMKLYQAEMLIELMHAHGELTIGGFDLSYYPKEEEPPQLKTEIRGAFVRPRESDLFIGVDMTNEAQVNERIEKMAKDLKNHNINVAFVAFKSDWGDGKLFYKTEKYPDAYYFNDKGLTYDPTENMVDIFHREGIEVHAWIPIFFDKFLIDNADKICIDPGEVRQPDSENFADPNNACVLEYEESIINEILEKYSIDGINLDYIR